MNTMDPLHDPGDKALECHRDLSSSQSLLQPLAVLARSAGGRWVIGVEEPTRAVAGMSAPRDLEWRIASLVADPIAPRLPPVIEIVPCRKTSIVGVGVHACTHTLCGRKARRTYPPLGSHHREVDMAPIEFSRRTGAKSADGQPIPDSDSEVADFAVISQ